MFKQVCGALIMASYLTTAAHSYNPKRLEQEAEECTTKVWAGLRIQGSQLKDHLHFLSDKDQLPQKYTQFRSFNDFYENLKTKLSDSRFCQFMEDCKIVYEESEPTATKVAVLMLVESVAKKFEDSLKKVEKAKAVSSQTTSVGYPDTGSVMEAFFNADRDMRIK